MKVVIIIPTFNEKGNIERLVTTLQKDIFPHIKNHSIYILVADDMSPDGTAQQVQSIMKEWRNVSLLTGEKHGLGAAYVRAMDHAITNMGADILFEMDADLSHDPTKVPLFLQKIDEGYDMVVGNRYSDGGSIPKNWPVQRKAFSIVGNILVRTILGRFYIHDWTGGYRALKKEVFLKEKDELNAFRGYTFQVSFLHKAVRDGFKVAEVPFHFTDRTLGRSKIAPSEYILDLLKYIVIARIYEFKRLIKFLFVGGTGFLLQILVQEVSIRSGLTLFLATLASAFISLFFPHQDISTLSQAIGAGLGAETAILSNFAFNNYWTFSDTKGMKQRSKPLIRLFKFNMTSLVSIFIQSASVWLGIKLLGDSMSIAGLAVPTRIVIVVPTIILFIIPLNYFIYNKIIWKTQYLKNADTSQA
jgi:dolichol-phosphate mannosyltransferase